MALTTSPPPHMDGGAKTHLSPSAVPPRVEPPDDVDGRRLPLGIPLPEDLHWVPKELPLPPPSSSSEKVESSTRN